MTKVTTPYHHGALRDALVAEGRRLLKEEGSAAITVRGLAKRVGVSHSAPLRHFKDRDEILDAIAAQGFDELTGILEVAEQHQDPHERLSAYAHAHVRFATDNGALMELMFSSGPRPETSHAAQAAGRFTALGRRMLGEQAAGRPGPLLFLLAGTLEGISALVAAGRLPVDQIDDVTDTAVDLLLPAIQNQIGA